MDYQLFEFMLLFAFYCIIGWVIEVFGFALADGRFQNRGLCRGPYLIAYGLGAMAVLYGMEYARVEFEKIPELAVAFGLGFCVGLLLGLLSKAFVNGLSGGKIIRVHWYHPILCGLGAVILIAHLNPLLTAYMRWASPWLHFIFLLVFWCRFVSDLLDGVDGLMQYKKNPHFSQKTE